jgi:hypothetical protein
MLTLVMLAGAAVSAVPASAAHTAQACGTTLEAEGYTWDGVAQNVGPFDEAPVLVCVASGPPERLPASNAIGCLLVNEQAVPVEQGAPCTGLLFVRRDGAQSLVWVQDDTAASMWVTRLDWNGSGFDVEPPFRVCKRQVDQMPLEPAVDDPAACTAGS